MLHTVYKLPSIQNDAREQRFDVTVATVAAVAVQQISYCMVSRDHTANISHVALETMQ